MRSVLRRVNTLPFEATIAHYFHLGNDSRSSRISDLNSAEAWDEVRAQEGNFLIPDTRQRWQRMCETPIVHDSAPGDLPTRAYSVIDLIEQQKLGRQLYSVGVGLAALEYHIKRLDPSLEVFCSDYSDVTTDRLKKVFPECNGINRFELGNEPFRSVYPNADPHATVLIHRVDPHLTDEQWRHAFRQLREGRVGHVLFVPHRVLTLRYLIESKRREYLQRAAGKHLAFVGYVRTTARWLQIWADSFDLVLEPKIGYSQGFLLKPRP